MSKTIRPVVNVANTYGGVLRYIALDEVLVRTYPGPDIRQLGMDATVMDRVLPVVSIIIAREQTIWRCNGKWYWCGEGFAAMR